VAHFYRHIGFGLGNKKRQVLFRKKRAQEISLTEYLIKVLRLSSWQAPLLAEYLANTFKLTSSYFNDRRKTVKLFASCDQMFTAKY
jgi:hypothetical protein